MQGNPPTNPELYKILGRALIDPTFRETLLTKENFDSATRGYNLTDDERKRLGDTPPDKFAALVQEFHNKGLPAHFV